MRKILLLAFSGFCIGNQLMAQDSIVFKKPKTDWSKVSLANRANDHFLIQFGYDGWGGIPDTITTQWYSRHFNAYVMYDMPFKSNPRLSFAGGIGVGTSSMFFDKMSFDLAGKSGNNSILITNVSAANHFKKYKIATTWLEVPLELRWVSNPLESGKSFKFAIGTKVGTMVDNHTKGKDYQDKDGNSLYGPKYKAKEKSRRYMNSLRIAPTVRIGWGPITLYGAYQVTPFFKDGEGPDVRPYSIGLSLGGL